MLLAGADYPKFVKVMHQRHRHKKQEEEDLAAW